MNRTSSCPSPIAKLIPLQPSCQDLNLRPGPAAGRAEVPQEYCRHREGTREAIGEGVDVLLDLHGRLSPAVAIEVAEELAPYLPFFLEEPCLPENVDALARVARVVNTPIATGERLFTRFGFRDVLEKQAAAMIQPGICHCEGILEARKIAAMAEAYYVGVTPHNPLGPVCMAASLQLDAGRPNFLIQEYRMHRVSGEEEMVAHFGSGCGADATNRIRPASVQKQRAASQRRLDLFVEIV